MRGRWGLALAASVVCGAVALAQEASFPAGGVAEALKARVGKPVTLILSSGTEIGGAVAEVRDHAVVLKGVTGKDFYDALVLLEQVAVVEARVRDR